jgi:hypothetical protein
MSETESVRVLPTMGMSAVGAFLGTLMTLMFGQTTARVG